MKYKWNLEVIYKDINDYNKEYKEIEKLLLELEKEKNNCFDDAYKLYNFLELDTKISILIDKIYSYSSMNYDQDTSNNEALSLKERAKKLYDKYSNIMAFFTPKLLSIDSKILNDYYKENDKLEQYRTLLDRINRYKNHTLSKKEEEILSKLTVFMDRSSATFATLTDCDITFDNIEDEFGNSVELSTSNYKKYVESSNREVRKNALNTLHLGYSKFANSINSIFYTEILELNTISKIKNYNSIIDMLVFDDEVDSSIYKNLVNTVNNNLDIVYNYFKIIKEKLNLEELHIYDTYAPLVEASNKNYTYDEAKEIVLKALEVLGKDYVKVLRDGYEKGWVDVYPNKAKRSGAYSGGSYLTYPYILLNYENRYNDVSTLAHESGHSMHSYYTRKNNKPQYGDYRIFVAEVASTVNELLLANYMLKNTDDKEEKIYILDKLMSLYKATIYRQTMFAEFEEKCYNLVENDIPFTKNLLCEEYYKLNQKYYGKDVVVDDVIKYEWLRIPHFYYKFYVYKYATGLSAATYIVKNILEGSKNARENYIKFLSAGSTLSPIESLKLAGVDLTKKEVVESALHYFKEIQEEFVKISKM